MGESERSSLAVQTDNYLDMVRLVLILGAASLGVVSTGRAADRWATLEAIRNLENPCNLTRPGPRGELGPYQFRESTWRGYTAEPFWHALDRETSDRVAIRHYEWIKTRLERAGVPANTYHIALAWNGGVTAAIRGRAPAAAHDYAQRATNLASVFAKTATVADAR